MKCSLCGHVFNESEAQGGCTACSMVKKCDLVRCPNCNFEMVPEPEWIKKLKRTITGFLSEKNRGSGIPNP